MNKTKKLNLIGIVLLLFATICWGSSFLILKQTIEEVPAYFVISVRFFIAGILLGGIFFKQLKKSFSKKALIHGTVLGVTVAFAYLIQTWGLKHTTPSRNAFMTATYCVMCPFLYWLIFKRKPKPQNIVSAILCLTGIGVISFFGKNESGGNFLAGDAITLCSAVFYAFQIIFIDNFQKKGESPVFLLVTEFFCVGIVLAFAWLIFELPISGFSAVVNINLKQWLCIGYLTLACTFFAQTAQMFGQRFTTANQSAVILSSEAVFGTAFSVAFGEEKLTVFLVVGFVLVFASVLISEFRFNSKKI